MRIEKLVDANSIDVSDLYLDHVCYRVETISRYQELTSSLEKSYVLLSNSIVGGRPIATFKIKDFIQFNEQEISVLEIPSPKQSSVYQEGFEHVEFVINCSLEDFVNKYPKVNFDLKNLNKKINPDVRLKGDKISIKFHCQSLEKVIEWEKGSLE